jgi:small subunit ribosomal protein S17
MFKRLKYGYVIRTSMKKTIVVISFLSYQHLRYKKNLIKIQQFLVHDEKNQCKIGDKILISAIRPKSKLKHFSVVQILDRKFLKF